MTEIIYYVLSAFAVLLTLTVHEYCHGYAAYKLGDPTAKNSGRLTLNPIKHLDPIGALCMIFFHFGWAKPVPIYTRNFKNPKKDCAIVALAGPLSNLIMAFFAAFVYLLIYACFKNVQFSSKFAYFSVSNTLLFFNLFHLINIGICIFNLIPVPPLDGSRILNAFLSPKASYAYMKYERNLYFIMLGWLLLGDIIASALLSIPGASTNVIFNVVAKILSLSDLLGYAIDGISSLMFGLLELIPFLKI
jgi:Zn-dependent protease